MTARNLVHLIIASNNERIIAAAAEERRFCVLDVSDKHMQDHSYFDAMLRQMDNGGREAMLYDLQREDLRHFNPRRFPVTAALQDQKVRSMDLVEAWWLKKLKRGRLSVDGEGWPAQVFRDDLLKDYGAGTFHRSHDAQDLHNALRKLLPPGYPQKGPRLTIEGVRKRTWVLPSLVECRTHFAKLFKMVEQWEDDED